MSGNESFLVFYDADAVVDFESVKDRGDRKVVFSAVDKL